MITISRERMKELLVAEMTLAALESGGVDNWEWHGYAMREYLDMILGDYDKEDFMRWVDEHKNEDQTREEFIDDMGIEDFVDYEMDGGVY